MSAVLPRLGSVSEPVKTVPKRRLFLPFFALLPAPGGRVSTVAPPLPPPSTQRSPAPVSRRSPLALPIPGGQAPTLSDEVEAEPSRATSPVESFIEKAATRIERELGPAIPRKATLRLCAKDADAATTPFGAVVLEIIDQMQGNTPLREIRLKLEGAEPNGAQEKRLNALVVHLGGRRKIPTDERGVALFHGPIPVRPTGLPVGTGAGR